MEEFAVQEVIRKDIQVVDQESLSVAGSYVKELDNLKKKIKDYFQPLKEAANKAHKGVCERENEEVKPIDQEILRVKNMINGYNYKRLQEERERRAREEEALRLAAEKTEVPEEKAVLEQAAVLTREEKIPSATANIMGGKLHSKFDVEVSISDQAAFLREFMPKYFEDLTLADMIIVSPTKLKQWVKSQGLKSFPGLTIEETAKTTFR